MARGRRSSTLGDARAGEKSESTLTVLIAFAANLLIAVAKIWAAALTGSASMVAEAAHSWADTGNEIFLMIANRRSRRPAGRAHPLGYGREAYVWSLFAALGLFVAGSAVSITHGIHELIDPEPATTSSSAISCWRSRSCWRAPRSCSRCGRPDARRRPSTGT